MLKDLFLILNKRFVPGQMKLLDQDAFQRTSLDSGIKNWIDRQMRFLDQDAFQRTSLDSGKDSINEYNISAHEMRNKRFFFFYYM